MTKHFIRIFIIIWPGDSQKFIAWPRRCALDTFCRGGLFSLLSSSNHRFSFTYQLEMCSSFIITSPLRSLPSCARPTRRRGGRLMITAMKRKTSYLSIVQSTQSPTRWTQGHLSCPRLLRLWKKPSQWLQSTNLLLLLSSPHHHQVLPLHHLHLTQAPPYLCPPTHHLSKTCPRQPLSFSLVTRWLVSSKVFAPR